MIILSSSSTLFGQLPVIDTTLTGLPIFEDDPIPHTSTWDNRYYILLEDYIPYISWGYEPCIKQLQLQFEQKIEIIKSDGSKAPYTKLVDIEYNIGGPTPRFTIGASINYQPVGFNISNTIYNNQGGSCRSTKNNLVYLKGSIPISGTLDSYCTISDITCNFSTVSIDYSNYCLTVDDPAPISRVLFNNNSPNGCPDTDITITLGSFYEEYNYHTTEIQVKNKYGDWSTVTIWNGSTYTSKVHNRGVVTVRLNGLHSILPLIEYGQPILFRTKKILLDGNYSYSYASDIVYLFPKFTFPSGKEIIVERVCSSNMVTIKIPYEGTINYNITTKNSLGYDVKNYSSGTLSTTNDGYYILPTSYTPGTYSLQIEYKATGSASTITSPCPFSSTFTVPNVPEFTLSPASYGWSGTDNEGRSVQIKKYGETGSVTFWVEGSAENSITLHAGAHSRTTTLSASTVIDGYSYYRGYASIDLPAGNHTVYASHSKCNTNSQSAILQQPKQLTFDIKITNRDCDGSTDHGTIAMVNVQGGIGTYSYTTRLPSGEIINFKPTASQLRPGYYTVYVADGYGNNAYKEVTIANLVPFDVSIENIKAPSFPCNVSDGQFTINVSGGAPPYEYRVGNQAYTSNPTITGYSSGDVTVDIKDSGICTVSRTVYIPEAAAMALSAATPAAPTCPGSLDGACTITANNVYGTLTAANITTSGTNTSYTVVNKNTVIITGLPAGANSVVLRDTKDGNTCSLSVPFTIPEKAPLKFTSVTTPVSNKGSATGSATVTASGGNNGSYLLLTNNLVNEQINDNTFKISSLPAGNHRIDIADSKGCSGSYSFTISEPQEALQLTATASSVSCHGGNNGMVTLTATGGWGTNKYSSNGSTWTTNNTINNLTAGVHTFYVKDYYGGTATAQVSISQPALLTINRSAISHVLCHGNATGSITYNIEGGTTPYRLQATGGNVTGLSVTNLQAGVHSATVIDNNGCTGIAAAETITQPDKLVLSDLAPTHTTCELANGAIAANASGGVTPYTYTLYAATTGHEQQQSSNNTSTVSFTNLAGDLTYQLNVRDHNGCSTPNKTQYINSYKNPAVNTISNVTNALCAGSSSGQVVVSTQKGSAVNYQIFLTSTDNAIAQQNTTGLFNNLPRGIYRIEAIDETGCHSNSTLTATVGEPQPLTIAIDSTAHIKCHGNSTGSLRYKVAGGTFPYSIATNVGTVNSSFKGADTFLTVSQLPATSYTFTVEDNNHCTATATNETITQPDKLVIVAYDTTHTSCELANGVIAARAEGGVAPYAYTLQSIGYSYTNTQQPAATDTARFNGLAGDVNYRLDIKDQHGCGVTKEQYIKDYRNPSVTGIATQADATCHGEDTGMAELVLQTGTTAIRTAVIHTSDSSFVQHSPNAHFSGLRKGSYFVDVYDTEGCQSNIPFQIEINEPEALQIAVDTVLPVINKGSKEGQILFNLQGGNNGTKTINLVKNNVTVHSLSAISGAPLNIGAYAGSYVLQATDSKGCRVTSDTLYVPEPTDTLKFVIKEQHNALCKSQKGAVTVEGAGGWGGYRYKLEPENTFSTLNTFDNLPAGSYSITVRDSLGATFRGTITITEPQDSLRATITGELPPACGNNGELLINLHGGTPPYTLRTPINTFINLEPGTLAWQNLSSGTWLLQLSDNNNCRFDVTASLPDTAYFRFEKIEVTHPTFVSEADGAISALVNGGYKPYTYQWIQDRTTVLPVNEPALENVPAGYYSLQVTDAKNCTLHQHAYVIDPTDLTLTVLELQHETSFKAANGQVALQASVDFATYELISPEDNSSTHTPADITKNFIVSNDTVYLQNLHGGRWYLVGRKENRQGTVATIDIIPYPEFLIGAIDTMPVTKPGGANGSILVNIIGGAGNNTYKWVSGTGTALSSTDTENTTLLNRLTAGSYSLEVEDRYGNTLQTQVVVHEPAQALQIKVTEYKHESCKTYQDAYVVLSASGGWGSYKFRHQAGATFGENNSFRNLKTGSQNFYVTDKYGTVDSVKIQISEPEFVRATVASIDSAKCYGAADGRALFTISGGTAPYSWAKEGSSMWQKGATAAGLYAGTHSFVVTDSRGCPGQDTLVVHVAQPDSLVFTSIAVTHTTCNTDNGAMQAALKGGAVPYSYRWSDTENNMISTLDNARNLKRNTLYHLTVTDRNGCVQQHSQRINTSALPTINAIQTTATLCHGDTTGTANVISVTAATPYAPYVIEWSNGDTGNGSTRFPVGTHHVTLTDTNRCSITRYFTVTQPDALLIASTQVEMPTCYGFNDGRITATTTGGVGAHTYRWSNGDTTAHAAKLPQGVYQLQVNDANGCSTDKTITVDQPGPLDILVSSLKQPSCYGFNDGHIALHALGGNGNYNFSWSTGKISSAIEGVTQGTYSVLLSDKNNCSLRKTFTIIQPDSLALLLSHKAPACYGYRDGYIIASVTGGTGAYDLRWSRGDTTTRIDGVGAGNYSLLLNDANGCRVLQEVKIHQPDTLVIRATEIKEPHCYGRSDGYIRTAASGGTGNYAYEWSGGQRTTHIDNLVKGTYHATLTDEHGCQAKLTAEVNEPDYLSIDLGDDVIICPNSVHVLDGNEYSSYRWHTPEGHNLSTARYFHASETGHYFLEAIDERGCPAYGDVQVTIGNSALQADFLMTSTAAVGDTIILIELSNVPLDSLQWSYDHAYFERLDMPSGSNNQSYVLLLRSLQTGIYNVGLLAHYGNCQAYVTKQIEIVEPGELADYHQWGYKEPLIASFSVYPNPNNGLFNVGIGLRETSDVRIVLFDVASGRCVDDRTVHNMAEYYLNYELVNLNTGIYVMIVTAGQERRQTKLVISK